MFELPANIVMDEFDLKWKTFNEHLLGVSKELGLEGHFSDVTLVSDDQIQTKAHKVVLSACSPVLKTLLVNNPHSHPLLYLRGIKQTELQAILKFMYFGETQIFENRINDFVSVAKDLQLKAISEGQKDEKESNKERFIIDPKIDNGTYIIHNEYASLNTSDDQYTAAFDFTASTEPRITLTLTNDHATSDVINFTVLVQEIK